MPYLEDCHNVMAYFRRTGEQTILVIANYQKDARTLPLPEGTDPSSVQLLLTNTEAAPQITSDGIALEGWQAAVLLL